MPRGYATYLYSKTVKGRSYLYFRFPDGRLERLPPEDSPLFDAAYQSRLDMVGGGRERLGQGRLSDLAGVSRKSPSHAKYLYHKKAKGRAYLYFRFPRGQLERLPPKNSPLFRAAYQARLAIARVADPAEKERLRRRLRAKESVDRLAAAIDAALATQTEKRVARDMLSYISNIIIAGLGDPE